MNALISEDWYQHQAVLLALSVNERLLERDGSVDPIWTTALFTGLLGLDIEGEDNQSLAIDPIAFPTTVRGRLVQLARRSQFNGWANAQFHQQSNHPGSRTAKLIATLVHHRAVPPKTLWRTAREELNGVTIPQLEEVERNLITLSAALRNYIPRYQKLKAITRFIASVPKLRVAWPALGPTLIQPVLDWVPVSVGDNVTVARPGAMIPVLIDVRQNSGSNRVKIQGTLQDTVRLDRSVHRALYAACALWRNRYSNAPVDRRDEVEGAQICIDLNLIEGIVQAVLHAGSDPLDFDVELNLSGRSLELPLALAIYDRLTGTRPQGEIRASGTLARFQEDKQVSKSGSSYLGPVSGTVAKALAAEEQLVDRFIVSEGSESPSANIPTVFARTLDAAVDHLFGMNGDGHRFVRGADLAEGFKDTLYLRPQVEAFRNILKSGRAVYVTDHPLRLILQVLCDVNRRLGPQRYSSCGRYTFVRLSHTESADAAWASIWSALDGDVSDFDAFSNAGSFRRRAELFVKQMARKCSSMKDPRWSPHVLVLAGVKPNNSVGGLNGGAYRRFDVARIMAEAETLLREAPSPCDRRLQTRIGATRIILASDDGMAAINAPPPTALPDDLLQTVIKLSAFRYGFSFDMARRQLKTSDTPMHADECERLLQRLQEINCDDGKPLLVIGNTNAHRRRAAPAAFEYMLRRRCQATDPLSRIKNHESAAHAITPFLHPARDEAHLGLTTGLSAPWLDEAYYQLSAARAISIQVDRRQEKMRLQGLRLRLLRLSGWFLLERLPAMMGQKGNDAVYRDFAERLNPFSHPSLHARAAAFATTIASNKKDLAARADLYAQALKHLDDGAKASDELDDMDESKGAKFLIASERCRLAYMGRNEPDEVLAPSCRNIRTFAPLAVKYLPHMREIYWNVWFAHVGGLTKNENEAREIYRAGLWNNVLPGAPEPSDDTLIGWVGTLGPMNLIPSDLLQSVRQHLANGFFDRREKVEKKNRQLGLLLSERKRKGMAQLIRIDNIRRTGSAEWRPRSAKHRKAGGLWRNQPEAQSSGKPK